MKMDKRRPYLRYDEADFPHIDIARFDASIARRRRRVLLKHGPVLGRWVLFRNRAWIFCFARIGAFRWLTLWLHAKRSSPS